MSVSTFFHGKSGSAKIGTATTINIKGWKITHSVTEHDTTSTTSGGYGECQGGIETVEGSIEAEYDTTSGPYTLNLVPGTYITDLKLSANDTDTATLWDITRAFIKSLDPDMSAADIVKWTVNFRSHGSFTKPSK